MIRSNLDIMSPQWTDVIFKDRNQAYGAYQLRKDNSYNTNRAVLIAASAFIFALALPTIINKIEGFIPKADPKVDVHVFELKPPPPIEMKKEVTLPPVQQRQVRSQQDVVRFPPPVVRPDEPTQKDPPKDEDLIKATTGQENMKGSADAAPAIDDKIGKEEIKGVTETALDPPFVAVEVQPTFPGGEEAFGKFLRDHIRYPAIAKENGVQGKVFLQFVVERDGSLTDMQIIRQPGSGLGEEAARVLKMSPHWTAGIQNGKKVRVQFTVPVNFSLAE